MKRNIISVILIAVAACFAASCEKDQQLSEFTGVIEQFASDSKTVLNSSDIVEWESTDKVMINGSEFSVTPHSAANSATFTGGSASSPYTAYYPASIYNGGTPTLPTVQTYTEGKIRNLPMYGSASSSNIQFHNICGVIELSLSGTKSVRQIVVTSADKALCGTFTVNTTGGIYKAVVSSGNRSVILDCGTGVALTSTAKKFWIAIPDGTHTLTFRIIATDGTYYETTTNGAKEVKANHIYPITWDMTSKFGTVKSLGPFISATRTLYFAQGNLCGSGAGNAFKTNQYEYNNSTSWTTRHADDLFKWAELVSSYSIGGATWVVPGYDDWGFVVNTNRPGSTIDGNATKRHFLKAVVHSTKGVILLPDGASCNPGLTSVSTWNTRNSDYTTASITDAQWTTLENAGCVFLPAVGCSYNGANLSNVNSQGDYWAAGSVGDDQAGILDFYSGGLTHGVGPKVNGMAVRLVQVR